MKRIRTGLTRVLVMAACGGVGVPSARATFHSYDVEEIFSTPDGSVQFVELRETEGEDGQSQLQGHHLTSDAADLEFPSNLPSSVTAFRRVLIATPGFAALPGAVTPDYILPPGFINVTGDTISIRDLPGSTPTDTLTFVAGELPLDGVSSLYADGSVGPNTPTNFNEDSGTVDLSATVPAASTVGLAVFGAVLIGTGAIVICRRRRIA